MCDAMGGGNGDGDGSTSTSSIANEANFKWWTNFLHNTHPKIQHHSKVICEIMPNIHTQKKVFSLCIHSSVCGKNRTKIKNQQHHHHRNMIFLLIFKWDCFEASSETVHSSYYYRKPSTLSHFIHMFRWLRFHFKILYHHQNTQFNMNITNKFPGND